MQLLSMILILGAGCPNYVKVFLQLIGDRNVSPYFTLRSDKGRRPMLNRGFTDIFLIKVKGKNLSWTHV